jgi:TRAP-type C4-dicarboxylate transport system permease small subunit
MKTLRKGLDKVLELVCVVIFIAMVCLTTYQVAVRYFANSPSSISETLTRYLFVWLILFSATYIFGKREHICIEAVKVKFTGTKRKVIEIIDECAVLLFAIIIMIYGGVRIATMNMIQFDSILNIPTGSIYAAIPVAGVLIVFYSICNIVDLVAEKGAK